MSIMTDASRPPDSDYEKARVWTEKMRDYSRPRPAKKPRNGIYWLRCAKPTRHVFTTDHPQGRWSTYSWIESEVGEWFIGRIEDGSVELLGSDEITEWDSHWSVVVEVGPEIIPPSGK